MEELKNNETNNMGTVKISDEVVSVIAGIAASEIKGVFEGTQAAAGNLTKVFGNKKNTAKYVRVDVENNKAIIEITVSVLYGIKIQEVLHEVQENVKNTVEALTGLEVAAVNVYVQNIVVPKNQEEKVNE